MTGNTNGAEIDPRTTVLVGVGQAAERVDDADYRGLSPIDLAVVAARAAVADTGADPQAVIAAIDTVACTRQFEDSTPGAPAPLGKSTKYPVSVGKRLGADPRRAVLAVAGGQSPQQLVTEFAREIVGGNADVVLLGGAEAISTIRHRAKSEDKPDFSDGPRGHIRGPGLRACGPGLHGAGGSRADLSAGPICVAGERPSGGARREPG